MAALTVCVIGSSTHVTDKCAYLNRTKSTYARSSVESPRSTNASMALRFCFAAELSIAFLFLREAPSQSTPQYGDLMVFQAC